MGLEMEQKKLISEFRALPVYAQRQVFDFIGFLRKRYGQSSPEKRAKAFRIKDEPFIGMWKDREDMMDSSEWLRSIRKNEWER